MVNNNSKKFTDADEVFDELVNQADTKRLLGLVAYALVEDRRIDSKKHQHQTTGKIEDSEAWYSRLSEAELQRVKTEARIELQDYFFDGINEWDADREQEIKDSLLYIQIQEIKDSTTFIKSLAASFWATVLFSGLVFILILLAADQIRGILL